MLTYRYAIIDSRGMHLGSVDAETRSSGLAFLHQRFPEAQIAGYAPGLRVEGHHWPLTTVRNWFHIGNRRLRQQEHQHLGSNAR